ncbi:MAG: calcineurin-like phosphoesterase C-terminal domain-containing protein [Alistipes sp.]|nr:calcineurin-like phosphoesterase C-terminal domain-containing protein [Alistipes sp.]
MRRAILIVALLVSVLAVEAKPRLRDSITIFGRVLCEGKPLADVPVSDGVHIVKTDSLGRYTIASNKWQNTVFVITPSGYEPECKKRILPRFWSLLRKKREVAEEHNFHLVKRDQSRHRIIFMSNLFLQNSNDDLLQFKRRTIPAARKITKEVGDSTAVYTFLLGDISNCPVWYSREFDVGDAVSLVASLRYPTMLYTVMGDQDNDGAVPGTGLTDYKAERQYVYSCGPKYYSMNIGDIHYIVLDNTVFRNEPGKGKYPTEIVGRRNYERFVTSDQLDWLRKDLALIKDRSKPIVVCMHQSTFTSTSKQRISKRYSKPEQVDSLTNCFAGFKNVHFVTSGSMDRATHRTKDLPHITEHAIASTSGDRWRTSYNGFMAINSSGTPAGFEVFDIEGTKMKWHHRSDTNERKPFRVYDMESVGAYYRDHIEIQNLLREYPKTFIDYGDEDFSKYIYINWWGFERGAKLQVFENDKPLRTRQIMQADPTFVVISPAVTLKESRNSKPRFWRNNCRHMFRVVRTSPTSTIKVRTTSPFGEVHEEVFVGKKEFLPLLH